MHKTHTNDRILSVRVGKLEPLFPAGFELFPELWNAFLFDPESGSGKINRTGETNGKRYSATAKYQFSARNPSWKLTVDGGLWQRSVCQNGQMLISAPDSGIGLRKEEAYRIADGEWLSTQYFRGGQREAEVLWNGEEKCLVVQFYEKSTGQKSTVEKFVLCAEVDAENAELCAAVFAAAGEAPAMIRFQSGDLFCYPKHRLDFVRKGLAAYHGEQGETADWEEKVELAKPVDVSGIPSVDEVLLAALTAEPNKVLSEKITGDAEIPQVQELWGEPTSETVEEVQEEQQETELMFETVAEPEKELPAENSEEVEELPLPEEEKTLETLTEEEAPQGGTLHFSGENGEHCIEYDAQGNLLYAGGIRAGERNGFGISREEENAFFTGTWLYGGRHGVRVEKEPENAYRVQFENVMQEKPDAAMFSADGKLLFAGEVNGGVREGFGFAQVIPGKLWYVGTWQNDLPEGNGMQLDADGKIQYCGGFCAGKREGSGTEYANGIERYHGDWKNDHYHGKGVLQTADGMVISGLFAEGKPQGKVQEYKPDGTLIYEGEVVEGRFHGEGTLYLPDGGVIRGQFAAGTPVNAEHLRKDGALLYRGGFSGLKYSGRGVRFLDGVAVYEGNFADGVYSGSGKLLSPAGETQYAGTFAEGMRCGVGAQFENGVPLYFGQWKNDRQDGCGIRYQDGKAALVGCFVDGMAHGRVNQYNAEGKLERELICECEQAVYMVEYGENGKPVYAGAVHNGVRSGMGRMLNEFGECEMQGIFSNGELMKSVQVMLRTMEELPCPSELQDTEYAVLAGEKRRFQLDVPFAHGLYSGWLYDGVPQGSGSVVFPGHCYTGAFENGIPCGEGRLYLTTGETVRGVFGKEGAAETLTVDRMTYSFTRDEVIE